MNKFYLISLFFILSCNSFDQSSKNDEDKKLYESIDFSQVDTYPKFSDCDELLEKSKEINCFTSELNTFLDKALKNNIALLREMKTKRIDLFISINRKGKLQIDSLNTNDDLNAKNSKLIKLINEKTSALNIQPALKQGIPVKVNFKMPVNIEYED